MENFPNGAIRGSEISATCAEPGDGYSNVENASKSSRRYEENLRRFPAPVVAVSCQNETIYRLFHALPSTVSIWSPVYKWGEIWAVKQTNATADGTKEV